MEGTTPPTQKRRTGEKRFARLGAAFVAFATTVCILLIGAAPAQAAVEPTALSGEVTGTLQDGTGTVSGLLNITKFKREGDQLMAVGKLTGTITDAAGDVTVVHKKITMPVSTEPVAGAARPSAAAKRAGVANALAPQAQRELSSKAMPNASREAAAPAATALSCQVLDLVLGPLDLNLLGLKVHLDTVHLNITAQGGPGNLLGNLLCAVAGLLDGATGLNGILNGIVSLLNQLLGVLG